MILWHILPVAEGFGKYIQALPSAGPSVTSIKQNQRIQNKTQVSNNNNNNGWFIWNKNEYKMWLTVVVFVIISIKEKQS